MTSFHKWKHWQVFMATTGLIIILYIVLLFVGIAFAVSHPNPDPDELFAVFRFLPFVIFPPVILLQLWYYSIGSGLHSRLPQGVDMNVGLFRFFILVPITFFIALAILMHYIFGNIGESIAHNRPPDFIITPALPFIVLLFVLFELFTIFCMFYTFYFCAKTLKSIQLEKEATFSEYVGEFFMLWFHFIGVWIIQPRINKLIETSNSTSESGL